MFCVECGTQMEQGKNFCGNCGARVARPAEPENESEGKAGPGVAPVKTPASGGSSGNDPRREQSLPVSPSGENGGTNKLLMVAAGIAILVLGTAGVYFGTDLFQPTASRTPAPVSEPLEKATEAPPLPSFEETKDVSVWKAIRRRPVELWTDRSELSKSSAPAPGSPKN